ncbi:MAG TPA: DUF354 domain-containing protein [Acidimicrobiales bacterium]|nr:DUF354 domain-containing protein [Acidimicrobiales bacterium]
MDRPMRVLFDIAHPAHVHFYRHLRAQLEDEGHETRVIAREKDVTCALLERFEIPHRIVGRAGSGRLHQARELVTRVTALVREGREMDADVVLTRNPSGVQAATILRIPGVFDTDDGPAVGIHWKTAAPFADIITTPDCLPPLGPKQRTYPGYKALAYLHPDHFTPDPAVLDELGVAPGEPFSIVRIVALHASHDRQITGLAPGDRDRIIKELRSRGKVFISMEGGLPPGLDDLRLPVGPHRLHDALAFAQLCVGDSQTMTAEAALLGTPALYLSAFHGRVPYLVDLEARYGLVESFAPTEADALIERTITLADDAGARDRWTERRAAVLGDKVDVSTWYRELLDEVVGARMAARS